MNSNCRKFGRILSVALVWVLVVNLVWDNFDNAALGGEIHEAARKGDVEKVKALLDADRSLINSRDDRGWTPLDVAVVSEQARILELSFAYGVDVNARRGDSGVTMLHGAASMGRVKVVEILLKNGADPNARDDIGQTPLHLAASRNDSIAEMLIAKGADVNARDVGGATPLWLAACYGLQKNAELFLAKGAHVDAKDTLDSTPLHLAAREGRKEIVELLVAHGADVNAKDKDGNTPLTLARPFPEIGSLLRQHGARGGGMDVSPWIPWGLLAIALVAVGVLLWRYTSRRQTPKQEDN